MSRSQSVASRNSLWNVRSISLFRRSEAEASAPSATTNGTGSPRSASGSFPLLRRARSGASSNRQSEDETASRVSFNAEEDVKYTSLTAEENEDDPEEENWCQSSRIISNSARVRFFERPSATWASLDAIEASRHSASSVAVNDPGDGAQRRKRSKIWSFLCWRGSRVIDPRHSSWLHKWDIVHAVILLAIALVWPYETAFLRPKYDMMFVFNRICDIALLTDMIMQLLIAYPDPYRPERVVRSHTHILVNYLRGWFFVDFLSVLPMDLFCMKANDEEGSILDNASLALGVPLQWLHWVRVFRLVRLLRVMQLFERWQTSFGISYAKMTLLKLMATLVLCCHWLACLWGAIAFWYADEHNWLVALREAKGGPDFNPEDHLRTYSLALYWAIITITSIGYGDITPQTMLEYHVATVCSTVMASIWAYVIGAICGIVSTLDQHEISWKRTMDDLNWFMDDKGMPGSMRTRLRRYFIEAKEMKKQTIEKEVITQMSPLLQGEVSMFMHQRWISKVWYLRDLNREIIVWAARNLTLAVFAPAEEVLDERTLFIVQRGVASFKGRILVSGDIWGEDMLLSNPFLREQSKARAMSHLAVLTLHIVDLFEVAICFAEARARLRWAQIQIATMRGVVRVAKKLKAMTDRGVKTWELSEEERVNLYRDILQGQTGDDEDSAIAPNATDMFSVSKEVARASRGSSMLLREVSDEVLGAPPRGPSGGPSQSFESEGTRGTDAGKRATSDIDDVKGSIQELAKAVQEMQRSLKSGNSGHSNRAPSFHTAVSFNSSMVGGTSPSYKDKLGSDAFIGPMMGQEVSMMMSRGMLPRGVSRGIPNGSSVRASISRMMANLG